MRFQVPQFIEMEDKIFGPFTLKQFIYMAGGAGICVIFYSLFPIFIAIILMAPVIALSLALAFYKVNNRPFINVLESFFKYTVGNKLYIWKKQPKKVETAKTQEQKEETVYVPRLSESKLKDLSWKLDVKEREGEEKELEKDSRFE